MKPNEPIEERLAAFFGLFYGSVISIGFWLILIAIYYGFKACHS